MLVRENRVRAADLNGLGIVAKERGLTIRYRSQGRFNFQLTGCYNIFLLFFLRRALIHEFARVSRAIIHGAVNSQKFSDALTSS